MNGSTLLNPPAADEIEFSLFGPSFGECAVCHLGNGSWMIVDSCLDPETRVPVALRYLDQIGVPVASGVVCIVATHWHDDHILGLATLLQAVPASRFAITSAFEKKDFNMAIGSWMDGGSFVDGKGLSELRKIWKLGRRPSFAGEHRILFERQEAPVCRVLAMSPSDAALIVCISELSAIPKTQFCTRMPSIKGNHASVVLSVEVENRRLLLGGDLQVRNDRKFGWLAVVDAHCEFDRPKHHVFKIPHHGSANADHPEIWEHLLEPDPHAVLAPFVGGKTKLPTPTDCERIKGSTTKASITASPTAGKFRHPNRSVEKTMREATRSLEVIPHHFGHVRLRGRLGDSPENWTVEHFGDAHAL